MVGVKSRVATVVEKAVDLSDAGVTGQTHGSFIFQVVFVEVGQVFVVKPQGALTFIENGGFKKGLANPVVGDFGKPGVGLIEWIDLEAGSQRRDTVCVSPRQGEEIVGSCVDARHFWVEVLQEKGVAEFGEICFEGIFRRLIFEEFDPVVQVDSKSIGGYGSPIDSRSFEFTVKIVNVV